ncbi:cation diffusion facilitator family transporter [Desulfovulcanus sp.]
MAQSPPRNIAFLSVLASVLTLMLKFGAYLLTSSIGFFSDAAESLINLVASLATVWAISIASRPADEKHSYGYNKAEYFASGFEGCLIIVAAIGIIVSAIKRFHYPEKLDHLPIGMIVLFCASLVNYIVARIMLKAARLFDSIALEADARHLMTDIWTSMGVTVGVGIIHFMPEWVVLDPIVAILVALNIMFTGYSLIKRSVLGLMDRALPEDELKIIDQTIRELAGKDVDYHGLKTRKAGVRRFIDFHMLVSGNKSVKEAHDLCCKIEENIRKKLPNAYVNIHVEPKEDKSAWED